MAMNNSSLTVVAYALSSFLDSRDIYRAAQYSCIFVDSVSAVWIF